MEKQIKTGNGTKPMTDKQRRYIEKLVIDRHVDESYKNCVRKALDNSLNRMQACKIIDFLISYIDFKKNFIDTNDSGNRVYGKSDLENMQGKSDSMEKAGKSVVSYEPGFEF